MAHIVVEAQTSGLEPAFELLEAPGAQPAVYEAEDHTLRAFVSESPHTPKTPRSKTQVDLVLPSVVAFSKKGALIATACIGLRLRRAFLGESQLLWPPILGRKAVTWPEVLPLIHQPELLWDCWKPAKTLDQYSLDDLWACYTVGEAVTNEKNEQAGMKPPLRLVEQHFKASWRREKSVRTVPFLLLSHIGTDT